MPVKWGVFLTNIVGTVSQLLVLTYLLGEQLSGVSHAILSPNKPDVCPESATHLLDIIASYDAYCLIHKLVALHVSSSQQREEDPPGFCNHH